MRTDDIILFETGSGGDFSIEDNDLLMGESLYQQIYLSLFGGNIEASTKSRYLESEERFDYWANSLFWKNDTTKQFNSETERTIQNNTLNSLGRVNIIQSVNVDLEYLKAILDYSVDVSITGVNSLVITILFREKTNQQDRILELVYDNAKKEVIIQKII